MNVLQVHPESIGKVPSLSRLKLIPARIPTKSTGTDPGVTERDLRDVNQELLLAGLAAQDQRSAAESALQRQLKALTIVAHELRNGLAPIQAASDLLGSTHGIDAPMLAWLQNVITRNTRDLSRLIEDLLDFPQSSTGQFRIERRLVDLSEIVREAVASCLPAMELRSQTLTVSAPLGTLLFHADPVRLRQVFVNLLDNACKYSPVGGSVSITAVSRAGSVEVSVCDNGVGIGIDMLPHVFDLFVRDTRACTSDSRGLGVGLAVVRELVEAHGGTITAQSAGRNQGSKFTATFPRHEPVADTAS